MDFNFKERITAEEAYNRTKKDVIESIKNQAEMIYGKIRKTIGKEYSVNISEVLFIPVIDMLKADGYTVTRRQCGINEYETIISWSKTNGQE